MCRSATADIFTVSNKSNSPFEKANDPAPLRIAGTPGHHSASYLAGLCQLRHHLSSVHDFHELLPERLGLGRFLRAESSDRLEVEQSVGLALFAGGLLQGDLRDHAGDRRQGTQQPCGVFQEPGLAGHRDAHQQGDDTVGPQEEQKHRFLTRLGVAVAILGTKIVVGTHGTGLTIVGNDAVLAHADRRRALHWIGRIPIGPGRSVVQHNARQLHSGLVSGQPRHLKHRGTAGGRLHDVKEIQRQRLALQVGPDDFKGVVRQGQIGGIHRGRRGFRRRGNGDVLIFGGLLQLLHLADHTAFQFRVVHNEPPKINSPP